jgi:hypothetical protein
MTDKIDILIPLLYSGSSWSNNELRYCLRSLEKNFKEEFRVIVIGDKIPDWLINVKFIETNFEFPYYTSIPFYQTFFDTIQKLDFISTNEEISENFIYCYDDIILLKEIDLSFFDKLISNYEIKNLKGIEIKGRERWANTIFKANKLYGNPFYVYEHHAPVMFNKEKLRFLFERYNFRKEKVPYAPISLYFNFWYDKPDILLEEKNDIICINKVDTSRNWLNYSNGWIENVKQWIIENFPNKSKYEKS